MGIVAIVALATHVLRLANVSDTDAAYAAWVAEINADCAPVVTADLGANVIHLRRPEYRVHTTCPTPPPARRVDIGGHGPDSTLIIVDSKSYGGGGGFALIIQDPRVRVHDFAIRGNAYDYPRTSGDGNSGVAIKFVGPGAADGEADHLAITQFSIAGVDVFAAPAVHVHDVHVVCPTSTKPGYAVPGMGIWVREIQRTPPEHEYNGVVDGNTVSNCSAEGITVANITHVAVRNNEVTCDPAACQRGAVGIALYSDNRDCARLPVSDNEVRGNRVLANHSISLGIAIKGGGGLAGSGHANVVDSNTVTEPNKYGIYVEAGACGGDGHSAYSGNRISHNMLSGAAGPLIFDGGAADSIRFNILSGRGANAAALIQASARDAIIGQNVIH